MDDNKYKRLHELAEEEFDRGPEELWWDKEGEILDTEEGRAKFCKYAKSSIYTKEDPEFFNGKTIVFVIQGESLTIKKRCKPDPSLFESKVYDASGKQVDKYYEPFEETM